MSKRMKCDNRIMLTCLTRETPRPFCGLVTAPASASSSEFNASVVDAGRLLPALRILAQIVSPEGFGI